MPVLTRLFPSFFPEAEDDPLTLEEASFAYWHLVQKALKRHGMWSGDLDGTWTDELDKAIIAFKVEHDLRARNLIGPVTIEALSGPTKQVVAQQQSATPEWIKVARSYLGTKEIKGARHNLDIVKFFERSGSAWFKDDETPWCGAFVGSCMVEAGYNTLHGGQAARARAWEEYGKGLSSPAFGCIVTFWRGSKDSGSGHVGFVVGKSTDDRLMVLGGNQSDEVNIRPFDRSRVTSYRWPEHGPMPNYTLPLYDSTGKPSSTNEA